jgi:hypothetical protein
MSRADNWTTFIPGTVRSTSPRLFDGNRLNVTAGITVIVAGASRTLDSIRDALTTTVSPIPAMVSVIGGTVTALPATEMSDRVAVANPVDSTEISYVPFGTPAKRNSPFRLVAVVSRMSAPVRMTVAPGTRAPVTSIMLPDTVAVCANATCAQVTTSPQIATIRLMRSSDLNRRSRVRLPVPWQAPRKGAQV